MFYWSIEIHNNKSSICRMPSVNLNYDYWKELLWSVLISPNLIFNFTNLVLLQYKDIKHDNIHILPGYSLWYYTLAKNVKAQCKTVREKSLAISASKHLLLC